MITVGVTGRMGAGKSTVARRFGACGAVVIDADALAHEVLEDPAAKAAVVDRFGEAVLDADGRVDRGRLAALVFGPTPDQASARAALEAIVHPRVRRRIEAALAAVSEAERSAGRGDAVVVLDVPLLVRSGWDRACDVIVEVECEEHVRRERLARRGVNERDQAARDDAWRSGGSASGAAAATRARKTAVQTRLRVDTSGELAYTHDQVDRIWRALPRS